MTKQTFTTGQVLTAAQMTSLQQTAMGGGSTTAKTASYVLVAADAGTVVQMNSASATTITVNTALFAAGDTVQIQNVGAGVCTVTAGTATVSTSATLALKQYDAGSLYFNTTSAAIFFAVDAADGMANPLTTTGDMVYSSSGTTAARLGIGSSAQVLTVASGLPSWATPSSGGGLTLLSTTSLSGASTTISGISGSYKNLQIILKNTDNSGDDTVFFQLNGDTGANYYYAGFRIVGAVQTLYNQVATTKVHTIYGDGTTAVRAGQAVINLYRYTDTDVVFFNVNSYDGYSGASDTIMANGIYDNTAAITSITIIANSGTFSGGTAYIYGVN